MSIANYKAQIRYYLLGIHAFPYFCVFDVLFMMMSGFTLMKMRELTP